MFDSCGNFFRFIDYLSLYSIFNVLLPLYPYGFCMGVLYLGGKPQNYGINAINRITPSVTEGLK